MHSRSSFTLIELLVVIAILAILAVAVVLVINPIDLIKQSRDSNRLSDLNSLNKALALFDVTNPDDFTGTSSIVYVSLPVASEGTCPGLPTLPAGYSYKCVTSSTLALTNGTGWIPINFQNISYGSPIGKLPVDPINSSSSGQYYTYVMGGSWHLAALMESDRNKMGGTGDKASTDGGSYANLLEIGSNLGLLPVARGDSNLLAWWKFDDSSATTTAYDSSGWGRTGSLTNGPSWSTDCVQGGCLSFDGSDDYVEFSDFSLSQYTKIAWIKPDTDACYNLQESRCVIIGNYFEIVGQSSNGYLGFYNDNFTNKGWHNSGSGTIINNRWQLAAVTWDGTTLKLYIDGVQKLSTNPGGSGSSPNLRLSGVNSSNRPFAGFMDNVRIYSRALSGDEVLAIYNSRN